ncbi:MAG: transglycosylase domain-containing protein, partial [Spirochaetaceae bacterium]|nr:transglycosylase domain-containing protein [Spirochaetaceae bacterium]
MQFIKEKLALNNPILAGITAVFILALAIMLGVIIGTIFVVDDALARENNIGGVTLALPTSIYDLDGELITEFFGDERRELLDFNDIPRITVQALISREDRGFFDHNGFSIRGTTRAVVMAVQTRLRFISGGSTITQQLAGHLYANRATDNTLWRKVRELWWAWQLEKHRSKHEILETYLNMMPFGHNTYGAQAASRFFFGHGLENTNAAESAMIVIQLANPSGLYSPIRRPPFARETQGRVIRMMVNNGFVDEEQAFQYYDSYWANYDWSRNSRGTAFFEREDRAPYFSEYIRGELHAILPGRLNIYRDGYHVYTTLNSRFQRIAEEEIERGLQIASDRLRAGAGTQQQVAFDMYLPIIELLALNFNIPALQLEGGQLQRRAVEYFNANVNPTLDMVTAMFGLSFANNATQIAWRNHFASDASSQIQAALITLNQSNGYIVSIIGGRGFDRLNQLNRAVNARIMPGSAIKPFYFAEAIASGRLTAASNLHNFARFWTNEDGTIYAPTNYGGAGSYSNQGVRLREALALSLNIPAIAVLEDVGFDAAIARTSRLMGITDPAEVARTFPRVWSLGLGIIGTTPLNMVRAFAVMANNGRETMPIAIRQIYDRNGRLVLDVENDPRRLARMRGEEGQILSPQAAFIMTNIMEDSVRYGTFYWSFVHTAPGGSNSQGLPTFNQPISGKTGTSQNWSDAWAIGYTPYYTTAVWLGFDRGGQTLGQGNEASSSSAHIFMRYMRRIHEGLPRREFERPSGIINATVDRESGLLPGPRTISTIN